MRNIFILAEDNAVANDWCETNQLGKWFVQPETVPLANEDNEGISGNNDAVGASFIQLLRRQMSAGTLILMPGGVIPDVADELNNLVSDYSYDVRIVDFVTQRSGEIISMLFEALPCKDALMSKDDAFSFIANGEIIDASKYKAINFIGDIHGCATALRDLLKAIGTENIDEFHDDEMYVFCGDYIDRGIENAEVLEMISSVIDESNVIVLEGNHERSLYEWGCNSYVKSNRFRDTTSVELEQSGFSREQAKLLYGKMRKYVHMIDSDGREIFACHGGLSNLPKIFLGIDEFALVHGNGMYNETEIVEAKWEEEVGAPSGIYMIHGHRHNKQLDPNPYQHVFNVEGAVEHGAEMRCVRFISEREPVIVSTVNTVFDYLDPDYHIDEMTDEEIVDYMRRNPYTISKHLGRDLTSYIISRDSFTKNAWKHQPIKARFIYIDNDTMEMRARSYDKIFGINDELGEKIENIAKNFTYPVNVYVKENGYGGLVSGNENGDLLVLAKNANRGAYVSAMCRAVIKELGNRSRRFGKMLNDMNATAVFELIDPYSDKHIVEYDKKRLVLCAIIYNDYEFEQVDYETLLDIAREYKLDVKERVATLETMSDMKKWYETVTAPGYTLDGKQVKGFIVEDANDCIVKVKTEWYEFWKGIRNIIRDLDRYGFSTKTKQFSETRQEEVKRIYEWLINPNNSDIVKHETTGAYKDVIEIRKKWEQKAKQEYKS